MPEGAPRDLELLCCHPDGPIAFGEIGAQLYDKLILECFWHGNSWIVLDLSRNRGQFKGMQFASNYTTSCALSATILAEPVIDQIFRSYFKDDYVGFMHVDDADSQRAGIDIQVITRDGKVHAVDLKACSKPVAETLDLEIYSVREERKLGYLLKRESLCSHVLFVDTRGEWRMFRRETLAAALRRNFQSWVRLFGVRVQKTHCAWRVEGVYSSSTLRVSTRYIRGAYYAQANLA